MPHLLFTTKAQISIDKQTQKPNSICLAQLSCGYILYGLLSLALNLTDIQNFLIYLLNFKPTLYFRLGKYFCIMIIQCCRFFKIPLINQCTWVTFNFMYMHIQICLSLIPDCNIYIYIYLRYIFIYLLA